MPKLSVALTLIVSAPAVESVSVAEASAASTSASEPEIVTESVPLPVTVEPFAVKERSPLVSLTTAVKVSGAPVLPLSDTEIPEIAVATPSDSVCAPGTEIEGTPLAVTAACCCAATPPKLSVALTVIGLEPAVPSVSVSVASAAFTSVNVPDTVRSVAVPPTVAPCALAMPSTPLESVSVTLKVSLPVDPASEILMPEIVAILFTPTTVAVPGTVITGTVPAVTAMVLCVATLPKLSVALILIVSAPDVESVSLNVDRSLLTTLKLLVMVRLVVPSPVTVPPSSVTLSSP